MKFRPGYIRLYESGELFERARALSSMLKKCNLCPRACGVDRTAGKTGVCRTGSGIVISASMPHFGEELPLVGAGGSGTIFFTNCNLSCKFCQNDEISHSGEGRPVSSEELSSIMLRLQKDGCHNINFVTPTHQIPQIVESLPKAIEGGLEVPLVFNCGGYESVEALRLLDGIFDIYMPDMKYGDDMTAFDLSLCMGYCYAAAVAIKEMHRQVGDLTLDERGIAQKGLIVRHLVLPEGLAGTREVMEFLAKEVSIDTYVNIMDQYRPAYRALEDETISRPITAAEFNEAVEIAREEGLKRIAGAN